MKTTNAHTGLWLVRRYPRLAGRLGWKMAKHPRATARAVRLSRSAPDMARRVGVAAQNPEVRKQLRVGRDAITKAGGRLHAAGSDPAGAVTDEQLWSELRRAAAAMAAGYAAAAQPPKPRRRLRKAVLAVGMIGAGTYAGYRVVRNRGGASLTGYSSNEGEPVSPQSGV